MEVHATAPEAVFLVLGTGPELADLRARSSCDHVRFVGYREEAASLVSALDVLVVPSRYEGFGLAAAEAMLLGVPVVASRTGGLEEVVGDSGMLVPPEDPAALAAAILDLERDVEHRARLGVAGRERALRRFGVERMAEETVAAYARVEKRR